MRIRMNSHPVEEIEHDAEGRRRGITLRITEDALPPEDVEVTSWEELENRLADYARRVEATGQPAQISVMKHPQCRARKWPNFDKKADALERVVLAHLVTVTKA